MPQSCQSPNKSIFLPVNKEIHHASTVFKSYSKLPFFCLLHASRSLHLFTSRFPPPAHKLLSSPTVSVHSSHHQNASNLRQRHGHAPGRNIPRPASPQRGPWLISSPALCHDPQRRNAILRPRREAHPTLRPFSLAGREAKLSEAIPWWMSSEASV